VTIGGSVTQTGPIIFSASIASNSSVITNFAGGVSASTASNFSGGLVGSSTNDSATAGNIGENLQSTVASGSAVSLGSGSPSNMTSLALTAGDWDVSGTMSFVPGASTSITALLGGLSSTTTAFDLATPGYFVAQRGAAYVPGANQCNLTVGPVRISLSASTTYFFVAQGIFTVSTLGAFGILRARRAR
jgi:hypothetical protein